MDESRFEPTIIVAVNASGWALLSQILLAGKVHQSPWYRSVPTDQGYETSL
ncbi:hypothetical protein BDV40DRAFT_263181, partial [Aspergillus tamarii]